MRAEAGGHRIQRCPRTERNGRVHSSTVTVAVLGDEAVSVGQPPAMRSEGDFLVVWFSGTGSGGQHRNKHQNSARVTHVPTGLVRTAQTRSRANSLMEARAALDRDLDALSASTSGAKVNASRQSQVGTGERSDRRRVWAFQRDVVEDLGNGRRMRCAQALRGEVDRLW